MRKTLPDKLESGRLRSGPYGSDASYGPYGCFRVQGPCGNELRIMASDGDGEITWEHVSVSTPNRPPNWQEMCFVKDMFWEEDECVVQFHPPKNEYVNNHRYCLHMWKDKIHGHRLPPQIAVGIKELGELPSKVDLRDRMPPVQDQGELNSDDLTNVFPEEDTHLTRDCSCKKCGWKGTVGQLMAGRKPSLYCPKCESMEIGYIVLDAPEKLQ